MVENTDAKEIKAQEILSGIQLTQYYMSEAARLFHAGTTDPQLELAEKLLKYVSQHEYVHLAQVYQYGPSGVRDAKAARTLIGILAEHGWLIPVDGGMSLDGKHRREVWRVAGHV